MRSRWSLAVALVAGCGDRYESILALDGDPVQGEILYTGDCASCHGDEGQGAASIALTDVLPGLTGTEILQAIDEGPGNMPAYRGEYTKQEMADLLEYMTLNFQ
jgi:mono/diheme cytochrome c family protein